MGVANLEPIREKLMAAQNNFCRVADGISAEKWACKPGQEQWCAAEVVAHLGMVEQAILTAAGRVSQNQPRQIPFRKRFHLPIWLVQSRLIRRKTPIPLDPELMAPKEEMMAGLRAARERTLAFMDETRQRNMSCYYWPHPFLGMLNTYEWLQMIAAHQNRHAKQMKEIAERLPKVV